MTDEQAPTPSASPEPEQTRASVVAPGGTRKPDLLPVLYVAGFIVLAGTVFYLWQHPVPARLAPDQASRVETMQTQLAALRDQVTKLEQKPGGVAPADFTRLQQQVAAAENRAVVAPADFQALSARVTALDARKVATPEQLSLLSDQLQSLGRQIPDVAPLQQKVTALEARPVFDPAAQTAKFNDLSGKLAAAQEAEGKLASRASALETQLKAQDEAIKSLTQRAQITARLQGMAAALAAGQKLGAIPGAPPALARFADTAPPTEAGLKESFGRYADAAQKASQPALADNQDFGSRLWSRAQQAVTVRQGDRVLLGDPISGVLAGAREKLDNGDLAGTVAALKGLAGPAAQAMAPWVDQAQALVAARAAIASLAAG